MRERILSEIRRLAKASGGQAPGKLTFARQTGISEHQWSGVLWARWSDALVEAGYEKNTLQARFDTGDVLTKVIEACRHYGHVPTVSEMKLYRRSNPDFPSKGAVASHFPTRAELLVALRQRACQDNAFRDNISMLLSEPKQGASCLSLSPESSGGFVYLLKLND